VKKQICLVGLVLATTPIVSFAGLFSIDDKTLPKCQDKDVSATLVQIINEAIRKNIGGLMRAVSVSSIKELHSDNTIRVCEAILNTNDGTEPLGYSVEWAERKGEYWVQVQDIDELRQKFPHETQSSYVPANTRSSQKTIPEPTAVANVAPTSAARQANTPLASFDCSKASTFIENAVCSNSTLGKLDIALAENYKYMIASNIGDEAKNDLKQTQRAWLSKRNKCATTKCVEEIYRNRIDAVCDYPVISGVHPVCTTSGEIK